MKKMLLPAVCLLAPLFTLAHEGHGDTDGYTIIHYFVEAPHAFYSWPLLILTGIAVYKLLNRKRKLQTKKI